MQNTNVGNTIRILRQEAKMAQKQLADKMSFPENPYR